MISTYTVFQSPHKITSLPHPSIHPNTSPSLPITNNPISPPRRLHNLRLPLRSPHALLQHPPLSIPTPHHQSTPRFPAPDSIRARALHSHGHQTRSPNIRHLNNSHAVLPDRSPLLPHPIQHHHRNRRHIQHWLGTLSRAFTRRFEKTEW